MYRKACRSSASGRSAACRLGPRGLRRSTSFRRSLDRRGRTALLLVSSVVANRMGRAHQSAVPRCSAPATVRAVAGHVGLEAIFDSHSMTQAISFRRPPASRVKRDPARLHWLRICRLVADTVARALERARAGGRSAAGDGTAAGRFAASGSRRRRVVWRRQLARPPHRAVVSGDGSQGASRQGGLQPMLFRRDHFVASRIEDVVFSTPCSSPIRSINSLSSAELAASSSAMRS